jgi:hypothetical protein
VVFEEYVFFFFVNIECDVVEVVGLECVDECGGVDEFVVVGVHEECVVLHGGERGFVDEVVHLKHEQQIQTDDITTNKKIKLEHIIDLVLHNPDKIKKKIINKHIHTKTTKNTNNELADLTHTDNTNNLTMKIETHETNKKKILLTHTIVNTINLTIEREQQHNDKLTTEQEHRATNKIHLTTDTKIDPITHQINTNLSNKINFDNKIDDDNLQILTNRDNIIRTIKTNKNHEKIIIHEVENPTHTDTEHHKNTTKKNNLVLRLFDFVRGGWCCDE